MTTDYILLLGVYFFGLTVRTIYEALKKRGAVQETNKAVFATVLAGMCALWVGWFSMCPLDPLPLSLPPVLRWSGLVVTIAGWGVAIIALLQLRGVENISHLVTTGVYSRIRHPMYAGFILWIFGWSAYHGAAASFLAGLPALCAVLSWRSAEESALAKRYGGEFAAYRAKTWW